MAETLLSPSGILLYGRVLVDLVFRFEDPTEDIVEGDSPLAPPRLGANKFLQRQLAAHPGDPDRSPRIARIYGFSYEGHYYDLATPALFLVHGRGTSVEGPVSTVATLTELRYSRIQPNTDRAGMAGSSKSFPADMMVWAYDQGDFSIRMDVKTGSLEKILLEAELSSDALRTYFGGQKVRRPRGGNEDD